MLFILILNKFNQINYVSVASAFFEIFDTTRENKNNHHG